VIDTEIYALIRQHKKNGFTMRKTAELLGISRNTVKRYWDGAHTPGERKDYPYSIASPQKEAVMAALEKYYDENKDLLSGKQRINARTAWEAIRETHEVGESTVRRYVRELKGASPEGFIPLSFEPGEAMQVDWCQIKVNIGGNIWKAPLFCAVLPYSFGIFAMVMPDMKMPCFIEANVEAFKFFGGIPWKHVWYDNLKTAVFSGTGERAVKQEKFRVFEAHYAFDAVFMNREAGWEKGAVENLCGLVRSVACVPIPKGKNLGEIQAQILRRCLDYIRFHKVRDRPRPIATMMEEERAKLMPLPLKEFDAYAEAEAVVGTGLTFRYDATKYSAPQEYIGKKVAVRASSYKIEAWHRGETVCSHDRPFTKGEHQYKPEHYLPLLMKRPRAIPNAAPLKYGTLPPELERFRNLCQEKNKFEHLANVLMLGKHVDSEILLRAVDYANRTGTPTFASVRFYLEAHNMRMGDQSGIAADHEGMVIVDSPQLMAYDELITKAGDDDDE